MDKVLATDKPTPKQIIMGLPNFTERDNSSWYPLAVQTADGVDVERWSARTTFGRGKQANQQYVHLRLSNIPVRLVDENGKVLNPHYGYEYREWVAPSDGDYSSWKEIT